ncbi:endonuclease III-like protein 1 [Microplitis demolitor]|uniref:endonuclease III-like protein 1 n=1 Tax=Microplitis demolitor TaxID=69319 RepID=UPI0004CD7718|nr:endonuclease III-like protein 1 [Microplitis demolitor]
MFKVFINTLREKFKSYNMSSTKDSRSLRSSKKKTNDEIKIKDEDSKEEVVVSKYFVAEILEQKKKPKNAGGKKRKSIEIKYEENQDVGDDEHEKENSEWFPKNWKESWDLIKEMRKGATAPVDDKGCHKCSDPKADPPTYRYQTLVSLMLSSQTKDQVNHAAMQRLKDHGCTPQKLLATSDEVLGKLIYPVSFWKRKVQYIKKTSEILLNTYAGDIPNTIEDLCALPGVGPKMGHLCMQVAWNQVTGIGVDVHVHRICNRLEWVKKQAKTPEESRKQLESWLPKELWSEINHLLVGFGQEICLPQRPKCDQCLNNKLCPFAKSDKNSNNKKSKK